MQITFSKESIFVAKPDGTSVNYYMFPEYEVHLNHVSPGCTQVWHRHAKVDEVIFILEGGLTAIWMDNAGNRQEQLLSANDMVMVERSFHTFENRSDQICKFIVLKLVLSGHNNHEIFKTDKELE